MTRSLCRSGKKWMSTLAFIGVMSAAGVAMAQDPWVARDSWDTQEFTITAPYRMDHRQTGRTMTGIPVDEVTVKQRVSYSDLNLNHPSDRAELNRRIEIAARQNCRAIDQFYPQTMLSPSLAPDGRTCVQRAVGNARAQIARSVLVATR